MVTNLEERKKKIELQKQKLQIREKMVKEKEKQRRFKRISHLVEIALKAGLDQLDDDTLMGAFLEIVDKISNDAVIKEWKKRGLESQKEEPQSQGVLLAITFKTEPAMEIRAALKKMKFRWNPFRKEFCGHGNQEECEYTLKGTDYKIEVVK